MILEDDPLISDKIKNELELFMESDSIITSETVEESLNLFEHLDFKIAVLDLNLPDGSGIKVLNKIQEKKLDTIVYVFSIDLELKNTCLKKGATAFFDKSKDFYDLVLAVKNALEN